MDETKGLTNMEESTPTKRRWRSEWIVAIAAIVVSIATLCVYIYQARIMQSQQHASVWPYVEWTMTFSSVEGIYLSVNNRGVGPALIKKTTLSLDGRPVENVRTLINEFTHGKADSLWSFTATVENRVMAPGDEIRLFHIKGKDLFKMDIGNLYQRIKYDICYCSIYGDCWISSGMEVKEGTCK